MKQWGFVINSISKESNWKNILNDVYGISETTSEHLDDTAVKLYVRDFRGLNHMEIKK
jgi:hypothetical protein